MKPTFKLDDLTGEPIRALLTAHFENLRSISPPDVCHVMGVDRLKQANLEIWSMWLGDEVIGCGGLMSLEGALAGAGELKSMRVVASQLGKGYGRAILDRLIERAAEKGLSKLYLETGAWDDFIPARRLYEKAGFQLCPAFGSYKENPLSTYMSKELAAKDIM